MYSGYYAYMLAGYLSNTGDDRFDAAGSLTFAHPDGRAYPYDVHRLIGALRTNFGNSSYCLFPCEPGWSYTMCNGYAVNALPVYDRLYGTDVCGEVLPDYVRGLEQEFVTLDGRLPMANNARIGLTLYGIPRRTVMFDALTTWQLAPIAPAIARRTYELMRHYRLRLRPGEPVQLGLSLYPDGSGLGKLVAQEPAMIYASVLAAAAEMGDTELVTQLRADIDRRFPTTTDHGVKHVDNTGVWSQMFLLLAMLSREGDHHDRIARGIPDRIKHGPTLAEVPYPDVLVAHATSDGSDLNLVLTPGREPGRFPIKLTQLAPTTTYTIAHTSESVRPDDQGNAALTVELTGRRHLHLIPQA
jgi:hypothetical protein